MYTYIYVHMYPLMCVHIVWGEREERERERERERESERERERECVCVSLRVSVSGSPCLSFLLRVFFSSFVVSSSSSSSSLRFLPYLSNTYMCVHTYTHTHTFVYVCKILAADMSARLLAVSIPVFGCHYHPHMQHAITASLDAST